MFAFPSGFSVRTNIVKRDVNKCKQIGRIYREGQRGGFRLFFVKKSAVLFYFREKCAIIQN